MRKVSSFSFQLTRDGIEARLGEMEKKIDRLRSLYETYFLGIERIPPDTPRREMNRMMLEMQQVPIGNASLRFRFQALTQRWVLHTTYWNRTMREIESGTCRRDMARAQRHLAERGGVITESEALALGIPKSRVKAFIARQQNIAIKKRTTQNLVAVPESPIEASMPEPASPEAVSDRSGSSPIPPANNLSASTVTTAASNLPGLQENDFEDAYQRYIDAHRELGIEANAVTKEKLRQRLGKQLPRILEEQKCQQIRLEVAVENGKVRLRAWPDSNKT